MASQGKNLLWSVAASISAVLAPFLLGASCVVFGIGMYRMVKPGPRQSPPGFDAGWDIIASAWPLFFATVAAAAIGLYAYRKTIPPAEKK